MRTSLPEHIAHRIEDHDLGYETPCWIWTGFVNGSGYGLYNAGAGSGLVHRQAYTAIRGSIPEGMVLDHLCRQRLCVNPYHLEPVTAEENARRAGIIKLTEYGVQFARNSSLRAAEIAGLLGIGVRQVSRIRNRHVWKHVSDDVCHAELKMLTETAKPPSRAYSTDAGWDLYADIPKAQSGWMQVAAGESVVVPTGVAIQVPPGFWYDLRGRSSTFGTHGLVTVPGVIDSGYQGELKAVLLNPYSTPRRVIHHQKIVQLVVHRTHDVEWSIVTQFKPSERGERGWGSSGA